MSPGFEYYLSLPSALGSDTTPLPSWAALNNSTWGTLKQALKGLSVEFALLADKAVQQVSSLLFYYFFFFFFLVKQRRCIAALSFILNHDLFRLSIKELRGRLQSGLRSAATRLLVQA